MEDPEEYKDFVPIAQYKKVQKTLFESQVLYTIGFIHPREHAIHLFVVN